MEVGKEGGNAFSVRSSAFGVEALTGSLVTRNSVLFMRGQLFSLHDIRFLQTTLLFIILYNDIRKIKIYYFLGQNVPSYKSSPRRIVGRGPGAVHGFLPT